MIQDASQVRKSAPEPEHSLVYNIRHKGRRPYRMRPLVQCSHCKHYTRMGFHPFYDRLRNGTLAAFFEAMVGECRGAR